MAAYKDAMFGNQLAVDIYRGPFKYLFFAYHPLSEPDRLGNSSKFPIGICFGDRDFVGSEGADTVIQSSSFFETGESQLFKIPNSGHLPHI